MALAEDVGDIRRGSGFQAVLDNPIVKAARAESERRGYGNWTDTRIKALVLMWGEGLSSGQIARQLGGVTRNAVIGKLHRLGLAGRAEPSRPAKRIPPPRRRPSLAPQRFTRARVERLSDEFVAIHALAPLVMEDGLPLSVLTLKDHLCKYPIGHPDDPDFAFCGRAAAPDCPYCAEHNRLTHQRVTRQHKPRSDHTAELRQLERSMAMTHRGWD